MDYRVLRVLVPVAAILAAVAGARVFAGRHAAFPAEVQPAEAQQEIPAGTHLPVLVELFTSEGCSSCPPADALLARFVERQPVEGAEIIALEEHVDYWNRLGWTDPYSSAAFTERQSQYSNAFGLASVYTPQMVIDGRMEFVGSDERRAREAIAQAAHVQKADVSISHLENASNPDAVSVAVRVEKLAVPALAEVFLAVTEDKLAATSVNAGENAGRQWGHSSVMRRELSLGEMKPGSTLFRSSATLAIPAGWRRENLRVVVFAQERKSRRILGVGAMSVAQMLASPDEKPPEPSKQHR